MFICAKEESSIRFANINRVTSGTGKFVNNVGLAQ